MRVDFYQLSRDPAEGALPFIARATLAAGERLLVVSADDAQLLRISEALWAKLPDSFLAHGIAGSPQQARQPILLSDQPQAANGANYIAMADGVWRDEADRFARAFLLFDAASLDAARAVWRKLGEDEAVERNYWRQLDGGKWEKAG